MAWFIGGYECVHSHCVYGKLQPLAATAEHQVLEAASSMLSELASRASSCALTNKVLATVIDTDFPYAHDTYNSVTVCKSTGQVYFAISSQERVVGGHCFWWDPETKVLVDIGDLTAACGEDPSKQVAQGKSHVPFFENPETGNLIFGTNVGFYGEEDGMEIMATPDQLPESFGEYPGGCILSLSPATGEFCVLGRVPGGEGIVSMNVDHSTGRCFVLTWPKGLFIVFDKVDASSHELVASIIDYPGRGGGEGVHPRTGEYRCICRAIAVCAGCAYWTNTDGDILQWSPHQPDAVSVALQAVDGLHRPLYLGTYDPAGAGSMSYHWRQVTNGIYNGVNCVLGVHGGSGYLFAFHPPADGTISEGARLELLERITSDPSRKYGVPDLFSYGYLGFGLHPQGKMLYYLTGGPITLPNGDRVRGKDSTAKGESKGVENLHLVSYDLQNNVRTDHGAISFANRLGFPSYVNSIAVSEDCVYALTRLGVPSEDGRDPRTVLMQIHL